MFASRIKNVINRKNSLQNIGNFQELLRKSNLVRRKETDLAMDIARTPMAFEDYTYLPIQFIPDTRSNTQKKKDNRKLDRAYEKALKAI